MSKEALKQRAIRKNGNSCSISGEVLPQKMELFDTHRTIPKRKGGDYTVENTTVANPVPHQKKHISFRYRTPELNIIKTALDDRQQYVKSWDKFNNQLLAYKRMTDIPNLETIAFLTEMKKVIKEKIEEKTDPIIEIIDNSEDALVKAAMGVRSVGHITVAHCMVYFDPCGVFEKGHPKEGQEKARHASCMWAYLGINTASYERYEKGKSSGGCKRLRTALYNMALSQMKGRGPYRSVYDNVKSRLEKSEKMTLSRNTKGHLIKCMWKDTKPSHRHGAALRQVMKHFSADWWYVARTLEGKKIGPLYPEAVLGGSHRTIMPEERGWVY